LHHGHELKKGFPNPLNSKPLLVLDPITFDYLGILKDEDKELYTKKRKMYLKKFRSNFEISAKYLLN